MLDLIKGAGSTTAEQLKYTQIKTNGGTQMRAGLNQETVGTYADTMRHNNSYSPFPPIIVYFDGTDYWLGDGFHRHAAAGQAFGSSCTIPAEVRAGTRRDAILHAAGANAEHGLPRSPVDKRRAVQTLLQDQEWRTWSNYKIAEACRVSEAFVRKIKGELNIETTHETQYIHPRTGQPTTMNTQKIGQSELSAKIQKLEVWLMGKGWSRSSGTGMPSSINKGEHRFEWNRDDERGHFSALKNAETIQLAIDMNDREITRLSNWLIERGWGIHFAVMPATCHVAKGKTRFEFSNREDKLGELAALRKAKTHEEAEAEPSPDPLANDERIQSMDKLADELRTHTPSHPSPTAQVAITEPIDAAIRRATCIHTGDQEKWQTLAATGADYWQILDILKSTITSPGGTSGAGCYNIEWRPGPIVKISTGVGGPVVTNLMSGRLVEAVRRAWAIPEARMQSSAPTENTVSEANDHRLTTAAAMLRNIDALLSDLEVYGGLTGRYTDIPPVERNVRVMRAELLNLIETLSVKE